MTPEKRVRLEAQGWRSGTVEEFLGLSTEEAALVEIRVALTELLLEKRRETALTQTALAGRLGTGQSRIAKAEHNHPSVSIDQMVRAVLAAGGTRAELGDAIAGRR